MTSTAIMGGDKSNFYADGRAGSPAPTMAAPLPGYEKYMARGPQHQPEYEMTRFDSNLDQAPLLYSQQPTGYDPRYNNSTTTLEGYPQPLSIPQYPGMARETTSSSREAPVHRPQQTGYSSYVEESPRPQYSMRSPSEQSASSPRPQYSERSPSSYSGNQPSGPQNMAGRGARDAYRS